MQPSDHQREQRLKRIQEAFAQAPKHAPESAVSMPVGEITPDPSLPFRLEPGMEFVSSCPIRVMPKTQPKGRLAVLAALSKSLMFQPGTRFRVIAVAASTERSKWYRMAALDAEGQTLHTGFVLRNGVQGQELNAA